MILLSVGYREMLKEILTANRMQKQLPCLLSGRGDPLDAVSQVAGGRRWFGGGRNAVRLVFLTPDATPTKAQKSIRDVYIVKNISNVLDGFFVTQAKQQWPMTECNDKDSRNGLVAAIFRLSLLLLKHKGKVRQKEQRRQRHEGRIPRLPGSLDGAVGDSTGNGPEGPDRASDHDFEHGFQMRFPGRKGDKHTGRNQSELTIGQHARHGQRVQSPFPHQVPVQVLRWSKGEQQGVPQSERVPHQQPQRERLFTRRRSWTKPRHTGGSALGGRTWGLARGTNRRAARQGCDSSYRRRFRERLMGFRGDVRGFSWAVPRRLKWRTPLGRRRDACRTDLYGIRHVESAQR